MKCSRAEIHCKTRSLPVLRFEDSQLTSYSGLILIQELFVRLGLKERLRCCFSHLTVSPVFSNLKMSLKRVIESPLERRTPGPQGMPGGVVSLGSAVAVHGCVERVVAVPCVTVLPPHCRLFP